MVDDNYVSYIGETWSLPGVAKHFIQTSTAIAGPRYFKYRGEWLTDLRYRMEGKG